ncbi:TlpA family protein disulfide reductase [Gracilimonas mengyeensis]|nr:redoxin domain-containing protein [Gracilimonas mengyeensis]
MKTRLFQFLAILTVSAGMLACSGETNTPKKTLVQGTITVADSLDDSGNYEGIYVTIVNPEDTSGTGLDTLFHEVTNKAGRFAATVTFPEKKYYLMSVSRNNNTIGELGVILAEDDTLTVQAELPGVQQTVKLESREHDAMHTFTKVDQGFNRIRAFAQSGALTDTQMVEEIQKWSDLYWEVYEKNQNSLAAVLAAEQSARLLNSWNQEEMLRRIDQVLPDKYMSQVALDLAKPYIARNQGFDAASAYMDSLSSIVDDEEAKEIIFRQKIQFYFDSSRVKEARNLLENYEEEYADNQRSKEWARRIRYDLNYLAPGVQAPEFSFVTMEGDTVNNEKLEGDVYILEISPLASTMYQNDFDRTVILHEIYRNYGLKILTIPLDQSEITVNAFFEERSKLWPVAKLGSFDVQDIIKKFNVVQVPTRLLIDENGVLIRKYEGREFEDVIQGINKAFRNNKSPS